MISKRGDFFVLGMSENTKGVHLSPLGFAACQSKKCTNITRNVQMLCWELIALLVHLRQVHPLNNLYNKSVCEKILHICQFCRNSQIIRTIKAGR